MSCPNILRSISKCPSNIVKTLYNRTRRIHTSTANDIESFGSYAFVLPAEPFIHGVEHIPRRTVPDHILRPPYARSRYSSDSSVESHEGDGLITLGSLDETRLRRAAGLAKQVLESARQTITPGTTTEQIDKFVHEFIISKGAYPSPLHYSGYPKACCTSVNNVIAHGIPDDRPLEDGDIVNVDITVYLDGFHGDTSQTFLVGTVDRLGVELVRATTIALQAGISACGPYKPFAGIGRAIQSVSSKFKCAVNTQFTGHGIGRDFHRPPWILHHINDEPGMMLPGQAFTIEPSLVQGSDARGWMFPDGWTVATESLARSAQAEHTVLITETGVDVLT